METWWGSLCNWNAVVGGSVLFRKTVWQGGGVALPVREQECIAFCLWMNEELVVRLHMRLKRQVNVGNIAGGVGYRPG